MSATRTEWGCDVFMCTANNWKTRHEAPFRHRLVHQRWNLFVPLWPSVCTQAAIHGTESAKFLKMESRGETFWNAASPVSYKRGQRRSHYDDDITALLVPCPSQFSHTQTAWNLLPCEVNDCCCHVISMFTKCCSTHLYVGRVFCLWNDGKVSEVMTSKWMGLRICWFLLEHTTFWQFRKIK